MRRADWRAGAGLVPRRTREDRRFVLVAGEAERTVGGHHPRCRPGAVVEHELELEAARVLVVADHLERLGALVVGEIEPVLQVEVSGGRIGCRFAGDRGHHARKAECVDVTGGVALQRAPERDQHDRQSAAGVLAVDLCTHALQQGREREGHLRCAVRLVREQAIEQRTAVW